MNTNFRPCQISMSGIWNVHSPWVCPSLKFEVWIYLEFTNIKEAIKQGLILEE